MKIISLTPDLDHLIQQAAEILVDAFKVYAPNAWPTLKEGLDEVHEMLVPDRILRIALDDTSNVIGWIGGIPEYDGHVWELHPLVIKPDLQGKGIGRALVLDFEEQIRMRGALTIMLGTDDEDNRTSLSNVDLYTDTWRKIKEIRNLNRHPFEFYQKMGYTITGVLPDANGDVVPRRAILPHNQRIGVNLRRAAAGNINRVSGINAGPNDIGGIPPRIGPTRACVATKRRVVHIPTGRVK